MNIKLEKLAREKQESRDIVKKILEFGISEDQKIDILYLISLSITDNEKMKKLAKFINNFRIEINNADKDPIINTEENKIIT